MQKNYTVARPLASNQKVAEHALWPNAHEGEGQSCYTKSRTPLKRKVNPQKIRKALSDHLPKNKKKMPIKMVIPFAKIESSM
jgi:hypothetical protein